MSSSPETACFLNVLVVMLAGFPTLLLGNSCCNCISCNLVSGLLWISLDSLNKLDMSVHALTNKRNICLATCEPINVPLDTVPFSRRPYNHSPMLLFNPQCYCSLHHESCFKHSLIIREENTKENYYRVIP